ncbi:MAG: hypothetical protein ACRDHW_00065 [Ktedonobacteraceae bacterium]
MQKEFQPISTSTKAELSRINRFIEKETHSYASLGFKQGAYESEKRRLLQDVQDLIKEVDTKDFGLRVIVARVLSE